MAGVAVNAPVRQFCRYCGYPEANQHEWDTIPEGEGSHLCWGECGVTAEEALDNAHAENAKLRAECLALINQCKLEQDDSQCLGAFEALERLENLLSNTGIECTDPTANKAKA